jgi:hypothetical protein
MQVDASNCHVPGFVPIIVKACADSVVRSFLKNGLEPFPFDPKDRNTRLPGFLGTTTIGGHVFQALKADVLTKERMTCDGMVNPITVATAYGPSGGYPGYHKYMVIMGGCFLVVVYATQVISAS